MARVAILISAMVVAACTNTPAPSPSPAAEGSPMPLRALVGDLGCDTIGIPYRAVQFRIDPAEADPVTAVTDQGMSLRTFWAAGFVAGSPADPVVRDAAGQVVATDGERLEIPEAAFPELHGHFVCPSPDALYIFDEAPS